MPCTRLKDRFACAKIKPENTFNSQHHRADVRITLYQKYTGIGIGTQMAEALFEIAAEQVHIGYFENSKEFYEITVSNGDISLAALTLNGDSVLTANGGDMSVEIQ